MNNATSLPFTTSDLSFAVIFPSNLPCTESYFNNNANDFESARSLIAKTSMPPRLAIARKTFLPILPKPFIPILIAIVDFLCFCLGANYTSRKHIRYIMKIRYFSRQRQFVKHFNNP
ncbi:hypothetical protein KSU1_C0035 [Candidatus Jettenia caeni]|uniref:Uncharacterized protein n=1 Tax=Candidatus Jettenia caeni TaxID=247490 RepID=I3IIT6_9BACT|nr:hypothetical protein KSU1_C0035 [Candidatus Jettenia caeni]